MKSFIHATILALTSTLLTAVDKQKKGYIPDVVVPEELEATLFSPNTLTPCVACIGVAPTGEVYAGVDQIGSLGKGRGKGKLRLPGIQTSRDRYMHYTFTEFEK